LQPNSQTAKQPNSQTAKQPNSKDTSLEFKLLFLVAQLNSVLNPTLKNPLVLDTSGFFIVCSFKTLLTHFQSEN
ncbi:MAG: hypothetical protein PHH11_15595, partial [Methylomonas sp.]|nr:hypothetical protein [Methylomonas sp.]